MESKLVQAENATPEPRCFLVNKYFEGLCLIFDCNKSMEPGHNKGALELEEWLLGDEEDLF